MKETDIKALVAKLTLEEKASLCSGKDFWTTKPVDRLGIKSWMMTDGPHGLRKQSEGNDHVGLNHSVPATCFPTAAGLAASWNKELLRELGAALGRECQANEVGTILGPGVNIKRSPLCGRNFEYFSEDPFLAGELAASHIEGVQSQGVGTSLKHFAANNQERLRMTINSVVDERTLREIYLPAFETAVKKAKPWTVMCAYNRLNGVYCSENHWLLNQVLRDEWGYDGIVVTDWGAANDRIAGIQSGNDLEMPACNGVTDRQLVAAVRSGNLAEVDLDRAVINNLRLYFRVTENRVAGAGFDAKAHHELARRVAGECIVLLKNQAGLLPLAAKGHIAFIGAFAKTPRYQGGGSSHIQPTQIDCAWDTASRVLAGQAQLSYAVGYDLAQDETVPGLRDEAVAIAAAADVAVLFIGLTDQYESEGYDRSHMRLPPAHIDLLQAVAARQKNVVVVLSNGSPVEMPWLDQAGAVLECYLGGQAGGSAAVDVLFGQVNPSGRLAETFPQRLQDNPSYLNFPGGRDTVEYREGLFVGYRHYDSADVVPLFPFGHGLSYTRFEYSDLVLDRTSIADGDLLTISLTVRNCGDLRGKEVVQLYVRDPIAHVVRPFKELKGFRKTELAPGESKRVSFELDRRAFAYWDSGMGVWYVEEGDFDILVGASSRDIRLKTTVRLNQPAPRPKVYDKNSTIGEAIEHPVGGSLIGVIRTGVLETLGTYEPGSPEALMITNMLNELPLRNLTMLSSIKMKDNMLETLLDILNGKQSPEALKLLL